MSEQRRVPSIRGRLLGYLLLPLLVLLIASIWVDHRSYVTPMYDTFDRALARAAIAIAANVQRMPDGRLDVQTPGKDLLPPHPEHGLMPPLSAPFMRLYPGSKESFLFRVSNVDGSTLAGDPQLPISGDGANETFSYANVHYHGMLLRVVSYRTLIAGETLLITAAETTHRRDMVVRRLDTVIGLSDGIQLLLVLGLCLLGITVALRPLNRLRDQLARQQPRALEPVPTSRVPSEVRPLVQSLNTLLMTVRDATQSQQHFLTNAAHQLRTPLTGLKAQLEVLAQESGDPRQQERIALLQGSVDRLAHTANQLLALARAEPSAHGPDNVTTIALDALVGDVAGAMLDRALARDIDLGAENTSTTVQGVYWLLHELLINLLDNAIRHTPDGGRITLRCGVANNHPFLEVEDNGPGIPVAERERVRERFYRAGGSEGPSSGLGLAIVEEIARSHRAHFEILDALAGSGARMRIVFPAN